MQATEKPAHIIPSPSGEIIVVQALFCDVEQSYKQRTFLKATTSFGLSVSGINQTPNKLRTHEKFQKHPVFFC